MRALKQVLPGAALAAAILALAAGPAAAKAQPQPRCGAVLTKSVKLHKDLLGCPGNGLVIGAGGITVDLNGHRVEGTSFDNTSGIDNSGGYDRLRIVDGKISHFLHGILLVSTRHSKVA